MHIFGNKWGLFPLFFSYLYLTFSLSGMIYICDNFHTLGLDASLELVSPQRRVRALRFYAHSDRLQSTASYLLLKKGLQEEYSVDGCVDFDYDTGGKPHLHGRENIHFNISHCKAAVACVVCRVETGIDVECIAPFDDEVARAVLSPQEYGKVIASGNPALEFCRYWTKKESWLKMKGKGLTGDIRTVAVDDKAFITFENLQKGYVCSVCCSDDRFLSGMQLIFPTLP